MILVGIIFWSPSPLLAKNKCRHYCMMCKVFKVYIIYFRSVKFPSNLYILYSFWKKKKKNLSIALLDWHYVYSYICEIRVADPEWFVETSYFIVYPKTVGKRFCCCCCELVWFGESKGRKVQYFEATGLDEHSRSCVSTFFSSCLTAKKRDWQGIFAIEVKNKWDKLRI